MSKFAVVEFKGDNSVSAVPMNWVEENSSEVYSLYFNLYFTRTLVTSTEKAKI